MQKKGRFEVRFRPRLRANPSVRCDFSHSSLVSRRRSCVQIRGECVFVAARFTRRAFELHDRRTRIFFPIPYHHAYPQDASFAHFTAILPGLFLVRLLQNVSVNPVATFLHAKIIVNSPGRLLAVLPRIRNRRYRSRIHHRIPLYVCIYYV